MVVAASIIVVVALYFVMVVAASNVVVASVVVVNVVICVDGVIIVGDMLFEKTIVAVESIDDILLTSSLPMADGACAFQGEQILTLTPE